MKKSYRNLVLISCLLMAVACRQQGQTEQANEIINAQVLDGQEAQDGYLEMQVSERAEPENFIKIVNDHHAIVHTQTLINAPIEKVWEVATDFDNMDWSPVFRGIEGNLEDGDTINLKINFGGEIKRFPQVLTWVEGQRFGWKGASHYGNFLHDNHMFLFISIDEDTTLLIQSDQPTGTDPSQMRFSDENIATALKGNVVNNYMAFNTTLKKKAEGLEELEQPEVDIEVSVQSAHPNLLMVFSPFRAVNHAEILIDAPAEKVWEVLTDFDSMKEWSSSYQNITGEKKDRNTVNLIVKRSSGKRRRINPIRKYLSYPARRHRP